MVVPIAAPLTAGYVTVDEFRAAPTWLDSDDLVPGGVADAQDAELGNVLLRASSWADDVVGQRLGAHQVVQQQRARIDRSGRLSLHASDHPVRDVTSVEYGPDPSALSPLADVSGVWVEDGRQILAHIGAAAGGGVRLEFGAGSTVAGGRVYVRLEYVAGHAATTLAAAATQGATTVTVADPAGIYPGDVLRIWDPGSEEAVTVASGHTAGSTTVPLAGALAHDHDAGAGFSNLPAAVRQAVILRTVATLLREDTASQGAFGNAEVDPTARRADSVAHAGPVTAEAQRLLMSYRRVR